MKITDIFSGHKGNGGWGHWGGGKSRWGGWGHRHSGRRWGGWGGSRRRGWSSWGKKDC